MTKISNMTQACACIVDIVETVPPPGLYDAHVVIGSRETGEGDALGMSWIKQYTHDPNFVQPKSLMHNFTRIIDKGEGICIVV